MVHRLGGLLAIVLLALTVEAAQRGACSQDKVKDILETVRRQSGGRQGWAEACATEKAGMLIGYLKKNEQITCTAQEVKDAMMDFCGPKEGTCEELLSGLFGSLKGADQSKTDFCARLSGFDPEEGGQSLAFSLHESYVKLTNARSGGFLCTSQCVDDAIKSYCQPFKCTAETIANSLKGAGLASNQGLKVVQTLAGGSSVTIDQAIIKWIKQEQSKTCKAAVVQAAIKSLELPACTKSVLEDVLVDEVLMRKESYSKVCAGGKVPAELLGNIIKYMSDKGDTCSEDDVNDVVSSKCGVMECSVENFKSVYPAPSTLLELKNLCTSKKNALYTLGRSKAKRMCKESTKTACGCYMMSKEEQSKVYQEAMCTCSAKTMGMYFEQSSIGSMSKLVKEVGKTRDQTDEIAEMLVTGLNGMLGFKCTKAMATEAIGKLTECDQNVITSPKIWEPETCIKVETGEVSKQEVRDFFQNDLKEKCTDAEIDSAMANTCPPFYECTEEGLVKALPPRTSFSKMNRHDQMACFDDSFEAKLALSESLLSQLKRQCGKGKSCSKCLLWADDETKIEELADLMYAASCKCKASDVTKALNNDELLQQLPSVCGLAGVEKVSDEDLAAYVSKNRMKKCTADIVVTPAAMFCTKIQNGKCNLDKAAEEMMKVDPDLEHVCKLPLQEMGEALAKGSKSGLDIPSMLCSNMALVQLKKTLCGAKGNKYAADAGRKSSVSALEKDLIELGNDEDRE